MGSGKQKAQKALQKRKLAAKKKNRSIVAVADTEEVVSGRQKHQLKVNEKRKLRDLLAEKKTERLAIQKSAVDGEERSQRRALCAEIKVLKVPKSSVYTLESHSN